MHGFSLFLNFGKTFWTLKITLFALLVGLHDFEILFYLTKFVIIVILKYSLVGLESVSYF